MPQSNTSRSVVVEKAGPSFTMAASSPLATTSSLTFPLPSFGFSDVFNSALSGAVPSIRVLYRISASMNSTKRIPGTEYGLFERLRPASARSREDLYSACDAFLHIGWSPPFPSAFDDFPALDEDIINFVRQLVIIPDFFLEALEYNLPTRRTPLFLPDKEETPGPWFGNLDELPWKSDFPDLSEAEIDELGTLCFFLPIYSKGCFIYRV